MSTKKYPNLPHFEFVCCDSTPRYYSYDRLSYKHKTAFEAPENPFCTMHKYYVYFYWEGRMFSSRHEYGIDLFRMAEVDWDEERVLTDLLKKEADKAGKLGKYEIAISVIAEHRYHDLAIVQPDGSLKDRVSITI